MATSSVEPQLDLYAPRPRMARPRDPPTEEQRLEEGRLPQVMEHSEAPIHESDGSGSGSSDEFVHPPQHAYTFPQEPTFDDESPQPLTYTPSSTVYTPSNGASSAFSSWNSVPQRQRGGSSGALGTTFEDGIAPDQASIPSEFPSRPQRPSAPLRTPSSTYAPARKPPQFISINSHRTRSSSAMRTRRDPNAQYRAQEKAYVQRVRQDQMDWYNHDVTTPSLAYSEDSETDDESPSSDIQFDNDPYDPETQLFMNTEDLQPTAEEMQNSDMRERLEWHAMLSSVLKGDVVKQEKQRIIGTTEKKSNEVLNNEIWIGVKAKSHGRTIQMQKKMIEEGRASVGQLVEEIISFKIKGETEAGKSPLEQVREVVAKIEKCEYLYSTRKELESSNERAASESFRATCDAVISWHNTTQLINTELAILQAWVGNEELDFLKTRPRSPSGGDLADQSSFIDRILKEDGLKSLQGNISAGVRIEEDEEDGFSILSGVSEVIRKAKNSLIINADAFAERHLPPYIEELLTLINFPSRLIQEIIKVRLSYAKKMKETARNSAMIIDELIAQFQIFLKLATRIKQAYEDISRPETGWDLPPCIDENFDLTVVEALKYYFKMLNWKLEVNRNTFKEAEILEQEWGFSNEIGRQLEGGDIEVAEQFSSLTAKSLVRLNANFERELRSRTDDAPVETERRYRAILDSVRVRQRKLFRFSRILRQRFENATECSLGLQPDELDDFYEALVLSGHFLVSINGKGHEQGVYMIASASLWNRPKDIQSIMGTSFHAEDAPEDPSNPYILVIKPEDPLSWEGSTLKIDSLDVPTDLRLGKIRLVADGSHQRLHNARIEFFNNAGRELDITVEQRANLARVNVELNKIKKTTSKLSTTIMDSVAIIRAQNTASKNPDLIQSCFAFATEFGKRSLMFLDPNRRMMNNEKLTRLALDWIGFIVDDCNAADRKTFKWAVAALEFGMAMTRGRNMLAISDDEYTRLRVKVAGCMSVLISHFDIMGARSALAAQQEKLRNEALNGGPKRLNLSRVHDDEEAIKIITDQRLTRLRSIDESRKMQVSNRTPLGRVLEGSNDADRSLTFLSSSATNVTMRWQQGQFVGGGTFGSVYAALNLDTGNMMAVKEIRLQDPQLVPTIVSQISDEMGVLAVLDHPNVVSYYGIEVHRDKVYIFMEYCGGGSVAGLLEHGRIEDETVIQVYALQMLEGLAYLHQSGIVHRDIKPENVLLDHNGVIKYVDFGAAKVIARQGKTILAPEPSSTGAHLERQKSDTSIDPNSPSSATSATGPSRGLPRATITGTPMYMSPEVIRGDAPPPPHQPPTPGSAASTATARHTGAADIWSLGCVILEMATGRRPWASLDNEWAIMYNIAQGNPPQLPRKEELSDAGRDFLRKCFDRDPGRRASAAELLQHRWIVEIRRLVVEDDAASSGSGADGQARTPGSAVSSGSGWSGGPPQPMGMGSRQSSSMSA